MLARHLTKSLRATPGDSFRFVRPECPDQVYLGVVTALVPLVVSLTPSPDRGGNGPGKRRIFDVAVGLLKGEGFEEIIEPSVCLGVRTLYPLLADRSQVHWNKDQFERKKARFDTKVQEASQLSGRTDRMEVKPPCSLGRLLEEDLPFMLFLDEDPTALPIWKALSIPSSERPLLAVTGPEGGWTDRERSMVLEQEKIGRACRASLGPRILPGRLAPIVVASLLSLTHGQEDIQRASHP